MKQQILEQMSPDEIAEFRKSRKNLVYPILYYFGFTGAAIGATWALDQRTDGPENKVAVSVLLFLIAGISFVPRIYKNAKVHNQLIKDLRTKYSR